MNENPLEPPQKAEIIKSSNLTEHISNNGQEPSTEKELPTFPKGAAPKKESEIEIPTLYNSTKQKRGGLIRLIMLMLLATLGFFVIRAIWFNKPKTVDKPKPGNLVKVAKVIQKTVPVQIEAIGNVQSSFTVAVTSQATGQITGVYFKKGEEVKKGQLLFTIDPRTQNAAIQQAESIVVKDQALIEQAKTTLSKDQGAVEQARATLSKDQGAVEQARATLSKDEAGIKQAIANLGKDTATAKYNQAAAERYNSLYKSGAVTLDQAQQYTATNQSSVATLEADQEAIKNAQEVVKGDKVAITNAEQVVKSDLIAISNAQQVVKGDIAAIENAVAVKKTDQAALENVKVLATYTKIYSPIDGKAGNILIYPGNVVQANGTNPLVTIAKIRPIQVSFPIPEANLPLVQKYASNGKLKVDVTFAGSNKHSQGILTFLNNTVDNTTGTIQLIGDFENTDGHLFPGQFVNTTLTLTQKPLATVVPSQAVQNGPNGQFVFVVKPKDMTVQNVPVTTSSTTNGLSVIEKGNVTPGEQVVIDGQANLVSGSQIRINKSTVGSPTDNPSTTPEQGQKHKYKHKKPTEGDS